jgi:hypothetical protein
LQESESFPRSSRNPSYNKEVSVAGPSNLTCLTGPQQTSSCEQWAGYPDSLQFSNGPVSYTPAWGFLNGMLIVNANPIIIPMKRPNNGSKLRWYLNSWSHTCWAGALEPICESSLASLKKGDLEMFFRIWQIILLIPSIKCASCLLVDPGHVSLRQGNVTIGWAFPWPL